MFIVIKIFAVVLPKALLAVIVYPVAPCVAVGVPVISQVEEFILSPKGNIGAEEQLVTVPVKVGVTVAMVAF